MNESSIIFKAEMVRAILEGRKTQTRRVMKPQPMCDGYYEGDVHLDELSHRDSDATWAAFSVEAVGGGAYLEETISCPYGRYGTNLWVRETWAAGYCSEDLSPSQLSRQFYTHENGGFWYKADGYAPRTPQTPIGRWRSSIHMPRWVSRLTLEITGIRVERLTEISDLGPSNDCTAEGVFHSGLKIPNDWQERGFRSSEKCMFHDLWESINGEGSWNENPWVWVVDFKRIEQ